MPLFFSTESFFESSGNAAAEFQENLRDSIVGFSCSLWSSFPGFITNNKNPAASFARGYMNSVCQNRVPLPNLPPIPFTGGQCPGILYNLNYRDRTYNITNCNLVTDQFFSVQVTGPIGSPFFEPTGTTAQTSCNGLSNADVDLGAWKIPTQLGDVTLSSGVFNDPSNVANPPLSSVTEITVTRVDGLPDNCGDISQEYDSPQPTGQDLQTTIIINSPDGNDISMSLIYNQLSEEFNFPMGFKLDGVNITLDMSGLTIHGDQSYTSPNTGNNPEPPGYDGGNNGVDPPYLATFPDQPWPALPELSIPKQITDSLTSAICNEGTIESIEEIVETLPGVTLPFKAILKILVNILEEVCQEEDVQAVVGYPEYYSVKPGASRPAIVYLYKTYDGNSFGSSTYSSTVNEPSQAAIDEILTVNVPDKTIGTFVASISLISGTRLVASGQTNSSAIGNLQYLIGKVNPAILPPNFNDAIVVTEDKRLNVTDLVCRQIEYYPNGGGANRSPEIRRVIDQP